MLQSSFFVCIFSEGAGRVCKYMLWCCSEFGNITRESDQSCLLPSSSCMAAIRNLCVRNSRFLFFFIIFSLSMEQVDVLDYLGGCAVHDAEERRNGNHLNHRGGDR
ncbi:uncharacterized protein [Elaeis guineensis]|uniref:uncharacterized protein isoform X1 n=1 Tax=Elaeis guineensis var. tenera TaxID=51953 RepID=UPI003C6D4BCA